MEILSNKSIPAFQTLSVESLGKPIHIIRDKLDILISNSCNMLTYDLQNWLKSHNVTSKINIVSLHTFTANEMKKSLISTFQHQDGGRIFTYIDSTTLTRLADSFYAAKVARSSSEISNSDLRLQEKIGGIIASWLAPADMWTRCGFELAQGTGLYATIQVDFDDHQGMIHIKLDECLVKTLTQELDLQPQESMYQPFKQSLESTLVNLNVLLCKKDIPLSELLALQPNDILPVELLSSAPASIGQQHLFNGTVADNDGQLVLILNHDKESFQ
ncbi:FliM/FliN family flagellar motor switch protein [Vibrio hepatarius]|uniref:FliM/FliN family flagellar motor switch protein n=1 Tax=Vibrio hepatarius TaxID=171383 RepID=UPI001C088873|nr:FliM/FliN family flagellar motor C-terminal domain-containing protein [Vibrio hepatarius]MBU2895537.1 FliM/FliN family flagellar motor C-terminal domain-containing protein [Vibrio hepatarius]